MTKQAINDKRNKIIEYLNIRIESFSGFEESMINSEFKDNIPSSDLLINSLQRFQPSTHEFLVFLIQMHFMHSASIQSASDSFSDYDCRGTQVVQSVFENRG